MKKIFTVRPCPEAKPKEPKIELEFWLEATSTGIQLKCKDKNTGETMANNILSINSATGEIRRNFAVNKAFDLKLDGDGRVVIV